MLENNRQEIVLHRNVKDRKSVENKIYGFINNFIAFFSPVLSIVI